MKGQTDLFQMIADITKPDSAYYNTTGLEGDDLKKSESKANNQERKILEFLQRNTGRYFAPHQIENFFPEWPITSIRRALTNMTQQGLLIKTLKANIDGSYGKPVHGWMLNPNRPAS